MLTTRFLNNILKWDSLWQLSIGFKLSRNNWINGYKFGREKKSKIEEVCFCLCLCNGLIWEFEWSRNDYND